jgi:hypothetical protein
VIGIGDRFGIGDRSASGSGSGSASGSGSGSASGHRHGIRIDTAIHIGIGTGLSVEIRLAAGIRNVEGRHASPTRWPSQLQACCSNGQAWGISARTNPVEHGVLVDAASLPSLLSGC